MYEGFQKCFEISFAHTSVFNIYKDPSPGESQKALVVVERMRSQVEELLSQWPEHPVLMQVLIHIRSLGSCICKLKLFCNSKILLGCGKVLQFDILDPLMKILAGLEYILLKAQVNTWCAMQYVIFMYMYMLLYCEM